MSAINVARNAKIILFQHLFYVIAYLRTALRWINLIGAEPVTQINQPGHHSVGRRDEYQA